MALRVIGAALPRTGTLSLKVALELLGFGKCYHMAELILNPEHAPLWAAAPDRPEGLDPLWDRYQATTDFPGCTVWRQLADRFPDAKVILTRRSPDSWFESVSETVGQREHMEMMFASPVGPALKALDPFGADPTDRTAMVAAFERYGEEVRAAIPAERLLEFSAKDGWEPLCAFLGVPVPDVPYPRINDRASNHGAGDRDFASFKFEEVQKMVRESLGISG